ncbi:MAG: peptidoglycan-associated lipoprotein Pal [Thermodesulfobacteriota bacterium]|nr:MAG: peptidoglycan-associated lipoprotein Pal [Thermodesulfobacteriota bacterium]
MKGSLRTLPVILLIFLLAAGCGKRIATEDFAGEAAAPGAVTESTVVAPEEGVVSGDVTAEDILGNADARVGGRYASLSPDDELTRKAAEKGLLYTIYFDYDRYTVRDTDLDNLGKNAKWLGLNANVKIRIEGHADERGETEYNLALGDKRARSVKKYLEDLGVKTDRMEVVSYGEEKPAVAGSNEEAWSKNRRAEFVIIAN